MLPLERSAHLTRCEGDVAFSQMATQQADHVLAYFWMLLDEWGDSWKTVNHVPEPMNILKTLTVWGASLFSGRTRLTIKFIIHITRISFIHFKYPVLCVLFLNVPQGWRGDSSLVISDALIPVGKRGVCTIFFVNRFNIFRAGARYHFGGIGLN